MAWILRVQVSAGCYFDSRKEVLWKDAWHATAQRNSTARLSRLLLVRGDGAPQKRVFNGTERLAKDNLFYYMLFLTLHCICNH